MTTNSIIIPIPPSIFKNVLMLLMMKPNSKNKDDEIIKYIPKT